jgi:hypothetical protein
MRRGCVPTPNRRLCLTVAAVIITLACTTLLRHAWWNTESRPRWWGRHPAAPAVARDRQPVRRPGPPREGRFHDRVQYYVHGSSRVVRDAAAPARAAAALGVTAAAPVMGVGTADVEAMRAKGRVVVLNASICEAPAAALTAEIERQLGKGSPVERQGALGMYVADACAVAPPTSAAYVVGDVATCFSRPVFAKARPCGCSSTVLLDLNRGRHFEFHPVSE